MKDKYNRSEKWVRNQLALYKLPERIIKPRSIVAIMDATRIGRTWCFVVRDPHAKENIYMSETCSESTFCYQRAMSVLQEKGFIIKAIIGDGKVALSWLFKGIPVQMCHFHQKQIIIRCVTLNPILPAGIELQALINTLTITTEKEFTASFNNWCAKWKTFLEERGVSEDSKSKPYVHRRLRSARTSIKRHLSSLFTFERYPELHIPNTTNSLDGSFKKVKTSIAVHAGLSHEQKIKMVMTLLGGKF